VNNNNNNKNKNKNNNKNKNKNKNIFFVFNIYMFGSASEARYIYIITILAIILMVLYLLKKHKTNNEGFTQQGPFIVKREDDIYDDFYAEVYDQLYNPKENVSFITNLLIEDTNLDKRNSVILVIGCETGEQSNSLQEKGFNVFIVDKSKDMIDNAISKYPNIQSKVADIEIPMNYDQATFTHVLCIGFNLYRIKDKKSFFRNIYHWLKPQGYFIIQLADRDRFNTIIAGGKSSILSEPHKFTEERITETDIDFGSFRYKSKYEFNSDIVTVSEMFTDLRSNNVRKNEQTLYMENIETIVYEARLCGFRVKVKHSLYNDENQFIYIFERPH
jgi:SAM-dependent methyltransferase